MMQDNNKKIYVVYINNNFFYEKLFLDFIKKSPNITKVISVPSKTKLNFEKLIYYLKFYKLKAFIYLSFKNLISGYKKEVKKECIKNKIIYKEYNNFNEFRDEVLSSDNLDLIISTIDTKVDEAMLSKPKNGWLNVHCGDLRKYRGINSPFWTMLFDEKELTMTIHLMSFEYDKGPIILEKKIINKNLTFFKTIKTLFSIASEELANLMLDYNKILNPKTIDYKRSKYFSEPKIEDSKKFLKKGLKYI